MTHTPCSLSSFYLDPCLAVLRVSPPLPLPSEAARTLPSGVQHFLKDSHFRKAASFVKGRSLQWPFTSAVACICIRWDLHPWGCLLRCAATRGLTGALKSC
jgi:hypothetical protein